jgi:hypothetical protein
MRSIHAAMRLWIAYAPALPNGSPLATEQAGAERRRH